MKFDLSQFAELDRTDLLEITGGYYSTSGRDMGNISLPSGFKKTNGSEYGYNSNGTAKRPEGAFDWTAYNKTSGSNNSGGSARPAGYDPKTGWIDPNTGKGTVAPPVPGKYAPITYSNGNGTYEWDPSTGKSTKISGETNAKYGFSPQKQYKIIVLADKDGVGGAGHTGIIMETPEGFVYMSKEGFASLSGDIKTDKLPNGVGVMIKEKSLAELQARMNSDKTLARLINADGDPSGGSRYEEALSFTMTGDQAATTYSALLGNVDNGYFIPGNQCNDLVQNSLRLSGSFYSGNINTLLPNNYTDWLSSQSNVQTLNVNSGYNF